MKKLNSIALAVVLTGLFTSCSKKDEEQEPTAYLVFKFKFDSTQQRLNNFGQPASIPVNHSAQSPRFNEMSAHYIELAPSATTALGQGVVVYKNAETTAGGNSAIDFEQSILAGEGEEFFRTPIKSISPGTFHYLRVSLAYQNYDINYRINFGGNDFDLTGTLASFIGFNTYIKNFVVKNKSVAVNANRKQGYWAFETSVFGIDTVTSGQAPEGATTVPNPISSTSPIPPGSCVVTGPFTTPILITGNETKDIVITVSLSTNKSFEWVENSNPGYFEPAAGDTVIDMGIRGLIPIVN